MREREEGEREGEREKTNGHSEFMWLVLLSAIESHFA